MNVWESTVVGMFLHKTQSRISFFHTNKLKWKLNKDNRIVDHNHSIIYQKMEREEKENLFSWEKDTFKLWYNYKLSRRI